VAGLKPVVSTSTNARPTDGAPALAVYPARITNYRTDVLLALKIVQQCAMRRDAYLQRNQTQSDMRRSDPLVKTPGKYVSFKVCEALESWPASEDGVPKLSGRELVLIRLVQRKLILERVTMRATNGFGPFSVLCDLDGVLHCGSRVIPGAKRFVAALKRSGRKYLFLTNSPDHSPRGLKRNLEDFDIDIPASRFYTSAQAIAAFMRSGSRHPSVYLVGSRALRAELKAIGAIFDDKNPEYVVVTSGGRYGVNEIDKSIELVLKGGRFITASREAASLAERTLKSGCGALIAPIERASGQMAYAIGKPNHLMLRDVERVYGFNPKRTLMIGDNLDTDINLGRQAEMKTVLVLSGITSRVQAGCSPYRPDYVFESVAEIDLGKLP
jgi:NagD protein